MELFGRSNVLTLGKIGTRVRKIAENELVKRLHSGCKLLHNTVVVEDNLTVLVTLSFDLNEYKYTGNVKWKFYFLLFFPRRTIGEIYNFPEMITIVYYV